MTKRFVVYSKILYGHHYSYSIYSRFFLKTPAYHQLQNKNIVKVTKKQFCAWSI